MGLFRPVVGQLYLYFAVKFKAETNMLKENIAARLD
jgi:hypothetical protein